MKTALDFLFLPNDWSSDISPYPQIVLLHPLSAPQSSPLSPQYSTKTLFLECSLHRHRHLTSVCRSLSDSSSLHLCYHLVVLWSCSPLCFSLSISESTSFCVSLSRLISMFPSAMVALTRTTIALKDACSPFFSVQTHTHRQISKSLFSFPHHRILLWLPPTPFSPLNPLLFSLLLIHSASSSHWCFKPFHPSNVFSWQI